MSGRVTGRAEPLTVQRIDFFTIGEPHEAQRLVDECPQPLKSVVKFTLATGLRRSEILDLEWSPKQMVFCSHRTKTRSDGTIASAMRERHVDSNTAWWVSEKMYGHTKLPIS